MKYFSPFRTGYLKPMAIFWLWSVEEKRSSRTTQPEAFFFGIDANLHFANNTNRASLPLPPNLHPQIKSRGWNNKVMYSTTCLVLPSLLPDTFWGHTLIELIVEMPFGIMKFMTGFPGPHTEKSPIHPWLNSGWGCPKTQSLRRVSLFCYGINSSGVFKGGASLNL